MLILRRRAYARAGLVGNPSDGYHGRTLSIIVRNFHAEAVLYEWEDLELVSTEQDETRFRSIHDLPTLTDGRRTGQFPAKKRRESASAPHPFLIDRRKLDK